MRRIAEHRGTGSQLAFLLRSPEFIPHEKQDLSSNYLRMELPGRHRKRFQLLPPFLTR